MLLRLATIFIVMTIGFFVASKALAQGESASAQPSTSVDSFALFWPLAPGKVIGEPLYFLKSFKESLRGFLIFGGPQKAEYWTLLATKRAIEGEKLYKNQNKDNANKSMDLAIGFLKNVSKVASKQGLDTTHDRLVKLDQFLTWLEKEPYVDANKVSETLVMVKNTRDAISKK